MTDDGRTTDARRTKSNHNSSPLAFGSSELIMRTNKNTDLCNREHQRTMGSAGGLKIHLRGYF